MIRNITTQTKKGEHMQSFVDRFGEKSNKSEAGTKQIENACVALLATFSQVVAIFHRKAFFIKLNCEKILESVTTIESDNNEKGIKTFASIEPIIDFDSSLKMIEKTIDFCDLYRIGLRSGVKADYYSNDKLCFFIGQVEGLIEQKHSNAKVYWKESVRERVLFADPDYWTSRNNVSADYNIFKESI